MPFAPSPAHRADLKREVAAQLEAGHCACCGVRFDPRPYRAHVAGQHAPTLDQRIPSRGYTLGNVIVVCFSCNTAKGDRALAAFREWVNRVHNHMRAT